MAQAIRALGPGATDAIPDLLNVLEASGRNQSGSSAFQALIAFGPALAPHLPRFVELSRLPVFVEWVGTFAEVFSQLAAHTPDALDPLRELLRRSLAAEGDEWNARWAKRSARIQAVRGLRALADRNALPADLLPDLAPLATDLEVEVRRDLVLLLGALGAPAAPLLRTVLTDTDDAVRARAADAFAGAGDTSDETVAALVQAVEDREPKVRRAAVDALNKLKVGTDAVLAALSAATADDDKKVAERAAVALKKVTPKEPKAKPAKAKKTPAPTKGKKKPT